MPLMKLLAMFCKSEADAESDRARQNTQGRQIDADRLKNDQQTYKEHQIANDAPGLFANADVDIAPGQHPVSSDLPLPECKQVETEAGESRRLTGG